MDGYKKFIFGTTIFLVVMIAVFIKIFILSDTEIRSYPKQRGDKAVSSNSDSLNPGIQPKTDLKPEKVEKLNIKLSESDNVVRNLLIEISDFKEISTFLQFEDIVKRFVSAVDNISRGESPAKNLDFLEPFKNFEAGVSGRDLFLSNSSFKRYDSPVKILISFNSRELVKVYHRSEELIKAAYEDLGYKNMNFDDTLYEAMRVLLTTPEVEIDIPLKKGVINYEFKNSELESLNKAQKHFLRMGVKNIRKVKSKIREIGNLLGFKFAF